jgi:hypothetical protein
MTKKRQNAVDAVRSALRRYEEEYPSSTSKVYRYNSASIRVRVIDPTFRGMDLSEREKRVWPYLESLSDDVATQLTMLVLITPDEVDRSLANAEFDHPLTSRL